MPINAVAFPIMRESDVLLQYHAKRNLWSIPTAQVEDGESSFEAVVRKAEEELGITPLHLLPVAMGLIDYIPFHEIEDILTKVNTDIIAICDWKGIIVNKESHKHTALEFHDLHHVIKQCAIGGFYSYATEIFVHVLRTLPDRQRYAIMGRYRKPKQFKLQPMFG